jgi:lipopolysaccharide transport system ATP-binding protein
VERFIDTPVKRYSTGMRMRLAFSVAAHLEADVLLIDEVLAVGDAAFQAKCLGRMGEVASRGRTVLLVSHNMSSIGHLCQQSVLLDGGHLAAYGPTLQVIAQYEGMAAREGRQDLTRRPDHKGDGGLLLTGVSILNGRGDVTSTVPSGACVHVVLEFVAERAFARITFALSFNTLSGQALFLCSSDHAQGPEPVAEGTGSVTCRIEDLPLAQGTYSVNISAMAGPVVVDRVSQAITVSVAGGDFFGNGSGIPSGHSPFLVRSRWEQNGGESEG